LASPKGRELFRIQWGNDYYHHPTSAIITNLENDLKPLPPEKNPRTWLERCGRPQTTANSFFGIKVVEQPPGDNTMRFQFRHFSIGANNHFAVKLHNAEWLCPWDDTPGLHQCSLPNGYVLRKKFSTNRMNTIIPKSHWFAFELQGIGIGDMNSNQYSSLLWFVFLLPPESRDDENVGELGVTLESIYRNIALFVLGPDGIDHSAEFNRCKNALTACQDAFRNFENSKSSFDSIITRYQQEADPTRISLRLQAIKQSIPTFKSVCENYLQAKTECKQTFTSSWVPTRSQEMLPQVPDASVRRQEIPRKDIYNSGNFNNSFYFSDDEEDHRSRIYSGSEYFPEAVCVHSYTDFGPILCEKLFVNLLWNETAKGDALRQRCQIFFNVDALPQELQGFLFDPNAPFGRLRFQILAQPYNEGQNKTQILRPHYAIANGIFPGKGSPPLVYARYAMRLFGANFIDNQDNNGNDRHYGHAGFLGERPQGFLLKEVNTHEGLQGGLPMWVVSPNNCRIAGTNDYTKNKVFYSVVIGRCMEFNEFDNWEQDNTAIVTLHILLSTGDHGSLCDEMMRHEESYEKIQSLPVLAKALYDHWNDSHQNDHPKPENPFKTLHNLVKLPGSP
jgi:hypothetical protein